MRKYQGSEPDGDRDVRDQDREHACASRAALRRYSLTAR
jgi:hypothetical protein